MELLLYNNKSDNNVLNKSIEKIGETIVLNAKAEISLLQPVFIVAVDKTTSNLNYCYCPTFNRYYYINNITYLSGGRAVLNCAVDVLMSWKDNIKAITGTVDRNENINNGYLMDNNYKAYAYKKIVCKEFPNAMDSNTIILMTVGG